MKQLKVCFLIAPGIIAGAEKVVLSGAKALLKAGINLQLGIIAEERKPKLARDFEDLALKEDINIKSFIVRGRLDFKLIKSLKNYFAHQNFDVIHSHGFKASTYIYFSNPSNCILISTQHGNTSHALRVKVYEAIERFILKHRYDHVVVVSDELKQQLLLKKIPEKKISMIENMLSLPKPNPQQQKLFSSIDLLFIGRLSSEKGVNILLEALYSIKKKELFTLSILGIGPQEDIIKKQIKKLGLEQFVVLKGFVNDITPFLKNSHALVMPSLREGLPMALIEAASWGIPVIASNVGGIPTIITNKNNGILVPPSDSDALMVAITEVIRNFDFYKQNAIDFSSIITNRFKPERWSSEILELYNQLLAK